MLHIKMLHINSVIINCFATGPDRNGISSGIYRKTATPCCDDVASIHTRPSAARKLFPSRPLFLWTTKALPSPLYISSLYGLVGGRFAQDKMLYDPLVGGRKVKVSKTSACFTPHRQRCK
jgi:hypothetical protein